MANKTNKSKIKNGVKKNKKNNYVDKDKDILSNKIFKTAEKLYKDKKYIDAYNKYIELLETYPNNRKLYKRLIESLTQDYTYKDNTKLFKKALAEYVTTYRLLGTKNELRIFERKLKEYDLLKASKSKFLITAFLGIFGVHKFLEGNYITGFLYLFSLGFFGIGVIIDLIKDYYIYEDEFQLKIFRYIISILILVLAFFRRNLDNYYFLIILSVFITPFVYNKLLKIIPNILKIAVVVICIYFSFKEQPIMSNIPMDVLGTWNSQNESTNITKIEIKSDTTTINFNDREKQIGRNEYDKENNILQVYIDAQTYYKFKIDLDDKIICTYNQSKICVINFKKK